MNKKNGKILELVYESAELIYNGWTKKRTPSARVIDEVKSNIAKKDADGSNKALLRAFCYLCAFEIRIKKKYKSLFSKIISFISWRKELAALKLFKFKLGVYSEEKISMYIERELWMLDVAELAELYNEIKNGSSLGVDFDLEQPQINAEEKVTEQNKNENAQKNTELENEEPSQREIVDVQRERINTAEASFEYSLDEKPTNNNVFEKVTADTEPVREEVRERMDIDVDNVDFVAVEKSSENVEPELSLGEESRLEENVVSEGNDVSRAQKNPIIDNVFEREAATQKESEAIKGEGGENINLNNYYSRERDGAGASEKGEVYNPMHQFARAEGRTEVGEVKPSENTEKNVAEQKISEAQENQMRNSITEEIINKGEDFLRMYIETAQAIAKDMMERETQAYIQDRFLQPNLKSDAPVRSAVSGMNR